MRLNHFNMKSQLLGAALLLGCGLSASAQATDSLFMEAAVTKLRHAKEYTLKVAGLMPADRYSYKPVPEEMSFAEQLVHLAENLDWLSGDYLGNKQHVFTEKDKGLKRKEEIIPMLERTYDFALGVLGRFNTAHLADTVSFFAGPKTKLQIINLVNDHQTHHRAQLLVYLRLNGIQPPNYVGW